ncbi:MAG: extracellular solute-binding protein [Defluviitaleaceae bacterium]|nr:extracellular solute-binding protein [Defluviitaleaceae bacterium]
MSMRFVKKLTAAAVILVLMASMAACGTASNATAPPATQAQTQTDTPAKTDTPAATVDTATSAPQTPAPTIDPNALGLSKFDPPISVNVCRNVDVTRTFAPGQSYDKNVYMTEYADDLGINLNTQWSAEGNDNYNTKLQLAIASGNLPDIFLCNSAQFQALADNDMLADLTDVLNQYQIPIVADNMYADGGLALSQCTVGGKVLALPQASVGAGGFEFMLIRDDWRQALNMPVPTTMQDVYDLAKAFVDQDPGNNGPGNTIGLAISNKPYETWFTTKGFLNGFGVFWDQWIEKDGTLQYGNIQPEVKTGLAFLNKMYNDGLLDKEFVVKDSMAVSQDAIAGKVGITFGEWWLLGWPLPDGIKVGQMWKMYPIPYDSSYTGNKLASSAKLNGFYVVRKGFDHPEALVKMYNLFLDRVMSQNYDTTVYKTDGTYDYQGLAYIGPTIGKDRNMRIHDVLGDAVAAKDPSLLDAGNQDQLDVYNRVTEYLAASSPADLLAQDPDKFATDYNAVQTYYGNDSIFGMMKSFGDNDRYLLDAYYGNNTQSMDDTLKILQSNTEEMVVNIISGAQPIDSFDQFVADWKSSGGDDITKDVNDWWQSVK